MYVLFLGQFASFGFIIMFPFPIPSEITQNQPEYGIIQKLVRNAPQQIQEKQSKVSQ